MSDHEVRYNTSTVFDVSKKCSSNMFSVYRQQNEKIQILLQRRIRHERATSPVIAEGK